MSWKDQILETLNEPQRDAVEATEGPVLILAGAGSGKTKTIVHRIAYLIHEKKVPPWKIVAVTFTNKAALEMAERAGAITGPIANECLIRTYHSLGLYLLRRYAEYINYPSNFTIWDDTDQRGAIQQITNNFLEKFNKTQVRYFAQCISSFKDQLISPEELTDKVDLDQYEYGDLLQEIYQMYEIRKTNSLAMDFSDLTYKIVKIFQDNQEVLKRLHQKYAYFLVDEYQDTNHAQYMMIHLLSKGSNNLCVVGDDDQAIYSWRGANIHNILDFNQDYPEAKLVKLEQNYRSTRAILDLSNSVISELDDRMEKTLWTEKLEGPKPKLYILQSDYEEASSIANMIDALKYEIKLKNIVILYRTNGQSRIIEEALLAKKLPYKVYGGISFYDRKEVKDLLAYLRIIANAFDEASFIRLINTPARGIGEKSVQKLFDFRAQTLIAENRDFISLLKRDDLPLSNKAKTEAAVLGNTLLDFAQKIQNYVDFGLLFEDLLEQSGLKALYGEEDRLLGTSRLENLAEVKQSMQNFQAENSESSLADYLQDISLYTSNQEKTDEDCLQLMTVHNAKGLEFDTVFLAGLDDDLFPHYFSKREGDGDEERRLLYVAITRAQNRLYLTRAKRRMTQGKVSNTRPSPFLTSMGPDLLDPQVSDSGGRFYEAQPRQAPRPQSTYQFNNMVTDVAKKFSSGESAQFKSGDVVVHQSFGRGRVIRLEGSGDATKIHIFFEDNKSRKFLLAYTKLSKA